MAEPPSSGQEEPDLFTELFDVSEADLEARGVDVGQYVEANISRALRDRKKVDYLYRDASESEKADRRFWDLVGRGFGLLLVVLVLLILSALKPLSPAAWPLRGTAIAVLMVDLVIMYRTYHALFRFIRLRRRVQ